MSLGQTPQFSILNLATAELSLVPVESQILALSRIGRDLHYSSDLPSLVRSLNRNRTLIEEDLHGHLDDGNENHHIQPLVLPPKALLPPYIKEILSQSYTSSTHGTCSICFENLNGAIAVKLPCNHEFHPSCIRCWFCKKHNCPTCRYGCASIEY